MSCPKCQPVESHVRSTRFNAAKPQDLVQMVWSSAKSGRKDLPFIESDQLHLGELNSKHLANLAWSFARTQMLQHETLDAIARRLCSMDALEFHPKGLAAIAWTWAKLLKRNMTLMDRLASHTMALGDPLGGDPPWILGSRELATIAWSFATFALYHEPLLDTLSHLTMGFGSSIGQRDLTTIAWCLARLRYRDEAVFTYISDKSRKQLSERVATPMDLANLAWTLASVEHADPCIMEIILACSLENISALDARQVASIVWSCGQLSVADLPLMPSILHALDGPLLDALPAQQVGWLTDSIPLLPASKSFQERVTRRLAMSVSILEKSLVKMSPGSQGFDPEGLQSFAEAVSLVGADQLGDSGSQLLLSTCGISYISPMSMPCMEITFHQHESKRLLVRASSVFDIKITGLHRMEGEATLHGSDVAVSGGAEGFRAHRWITPVHLPVAAGVDRSLCGEFQLLARLCDQVLHKTGGVLPPTETVTGTIHLFVTATPCLSCVAALCQFHRLFPELQLKVSWNKVSTKRMEKSNHHNHSHHMSPSHTYIHHPSSDIIPHHLAHSAFVRRHVAYRHLGWILVKPGQRETKPWLDSRNLSHARVNTPKMWWLGW